MTVSARQMCALPSAPCNQHTAVLAGEKRAAAGADPLLYRLVSRCPCVASPLECETLRSSATTASRWQRRAQNKQGVRPT